MFREVWGVSTGGRLSGYLCARSSKWEVSLAAATGFTAAVQIFNSVEWRISLVCRGVTFPRPEILRGRYVVSWWCGCYGGGVTQILHFILAKVFLVFFFSRARLYFEWAICLQICIVVVFVDPPPPPAG